MNGFFKGGGFWWRGWMYLITRPKLLILALIPLFLAILLTVGLTGLVFAQLPSWVRALTEIAIGSGPEWLSNIFYYSVVIFGSLVVVVGFIYVGYILNMLLASPFYSLLVERVLVNAGAPVKPFGLGHALRMVRVSLVKAVIFLCLGLMIFIMSLVPGLNVVALSCTVLLFAFDLADYAFEALGWNFRTRLNFMKNHRMIWAGMAVGLGLTFIVPGLTLLILPGAVTGAALVISEIVNAELVPKHSTEGL